jgi:hypothetical protein
MQEVGWSTNFRINWRYSALTSVVSEKSDEIVEERRDKLYSETKPKGV